MTTRCRKCGNQLLDVNDVAVMLGVHVKSVPRIRRDDDTFPDPHFLSAPLWSEEEIRVWAESTGRL